MAAPPKPYVPVHTIEAGGTRTQSLYPLVDHTGTPRWEAGDTDIRRWDITSIGWCHAGPSNRKDTTRLKGAIYLTGARVVVSSDHFAHGSRYRAYGPGVGLVTTAIATKVSNARAQHAAAGSFLVGQMRLPWLTRVVYGPPNGRKGFRGELRLCGEHLSAFGDPEAVILLVTLRQPAEVEPFAHALLAKVRADRLTFEKTKDEARAALEAARVPVGANPQDGTLPSVSFAAAWRVGADTGYWGAVSALSRPVAPQPSPAAGA